jgi:two-component system, sensor histidine kinase and response regulator
MSTKAELLQAIDRCADQDFLDKLLLHCQQLEAQASPSVFASLKQAQDETAGLKIQKEKFFAIVSYELGSPLNSLKSMADFLMMDVEAADNPFLSESAKMLMAQIEKLQLQMSNLIEWANMEMKNYVFTCNTFALREILENSVQLFEKQANAKSINLLYKTPKSVLVSGDNRMLQLVINNLLSNAVKFSRKGDSIEIWASQEQTQAVIQIKDTGIGMGKAKIDNLFNVNRKATQKGTANENGYGLGLITCKAILDLHNTKLHIHSEQGRGSTFSFALPLSV